MPKRSRTDEPATTPKEPARRAPARDENQAAYDSLQQIIRATEGTGKDPIAVALGRRGGLKGGRARAEKLSESERRASAVKAARARWDKPK